MHDTVKIVVLSLVIMAVVNRVDFIKKIVAPN